MSLFVKHTSEPSSHNPVPVHSLLKAIREQAGYSLEQMSLTCGLALKEITDLEDGHDTDPEKLRRIAGALRLPEGTFLPSEGGTA